MNNKKKKAEQWGRMAEFLCVISLCLRGYRILAMRFKTPAGEIDIIARRRKVLAFIEVKARATTEQARHAIAHRSKQRIYRASMLFLTKNPTLSTLDLRFDAMLVTPLRTPCHIKGAWDHVGQWGDL